MRIAYVYDAVYPWETGGVQKRVWEIARRLTDRHDIHWYGLKYWEGPAVIEREGVTLHGVMESTDLYVKGRRSIPEAVFFSANLVRPLLQDKFDVIDCQSFPFFPAFSSKLSTVMGHSTLVLTWHEIWGDYWDEYLGKKGIFGKAVERTTALLPDIHVAVSEQTCRDLGQLGVSNSQLVPNGIEMDKIESIPPADEQIDILYSGRLIPEKNVALLVRSVDQLRREERDIKCVIVGDGPERSRIESLVKKLGLESTISVRGYVEDYEEVLALMKAASIFTLPSRREGFGICTLEALACGTPVVTCNHPQNAAQELVEDGVTGAVCDLTPEAIAAGIRRAQETASPAACTASAREYEWDRIADMTEQMYVTAAR